MNYLIGIAAEYKLTGMTQGFQNQPQLHRRHILHFIHKNHIITVPGQWQVLVAEKITVILTRLFQPCNITLKQGVNRRTVIHIIK